MLYQRTRHHWPERRGEGESLLALIFRVGTTEGGGSVCALHYEVLLCTQSRFLYSANVGVGCQVRRTRQGVSGVSTETPATRLAHYYTAIPPQRATVPSRAIMTRSKTRSIA